MALLLIVILVSTQKFAMMSNNTQPALTCMHLTAATPHVDSICLPVRVSHMVLTCSVVFFFPCHLVQHEDKSLLYGVSTALVNLTNSYDKPEKNDELEKLGKFAGENVPQEHMLVCAVTTDNMVLLCVCFVHDVSISSTYF